MVDLNNFDQFEIISTNGPSENVKNVLKPQKIFTGGVIHGLKNGDRIEISSASVKLMDDVCELLKKGLNTSLFIDYGENRAFSDSIRVFLR